MYTYMISTKMSVKSFNSPFVSKTLHYGLLKRLVLLNGTIISPTKGERCGLLLKLDRDFT